MAKFVKAPNINDEYILPETSGSDGQVLTAGSGTVTAWETLSIPSGNQIIDWTVDQGSTNIHTGNYVNTVYSHPGFNGDDIDIDTGALTGATVISDLDFNITTNTEGHVTDANGTFSTRNLTAADIGAQPAGTYNTVIGTDSDINTSGSTIIDNIYVTDGVITSMGTRALTAADVGAVASTDTFRTVGKTSGSATAGWVTVASAGGSRYSGEVIVTDGESGDHSFIRIHWMRSYADSNFSVLNCGGHANRIQGVRVLRTSDTTYGTKYLQVYVTVTSNYYVRVLKEGDTPNYGTLTVLIPSTSNPAGTVQQGNALLNLQDSTLAAEQGITVGGTVYTNSNGNSSEWNTAYGWGDHAAEGYVTSSGNTVIGTDADINTSGATVVDQLNMTDGVITSHSTRTMTLADLGYTGATNANNYVHPSYNGDDLSIDTGVMGGATVISDLNFAVTTDTQGHVSYTGGFANTRTMTLADLGYTGATNANYITNNNQLTNGAGYTTYTANQAVNTSSSPSFINMYLTNAIYHTSDTNTYMSFPANDTINWATSGSERMRLNSSGNLGIGTTSPGTKLHVVGSAGQFALSLQNSSNGDGIKITTENQTANNGFLWNQGSSNLVNMYSSSTTNAAKMIMLAGGVDKIFFNTEGSSYFNGGNVGIGTTSPGYTLDVNGSLHSTNLNIADGIYHEGDTNTYMQFHASDQWRVVTGGTERLEVNNARTYVNGYLEASASLRAPTFYDSNNTAYYVNPASTSNLLGLKVGYNDLELEDTANTYSPEFKMQNNTHTVGIDYQNNETLRFITRSGVVTVPITFQMRAGTITAANFILSSDERKKTNIEDLTPKTINANWKSFEMKDNLGEYRTGVIAQELENDHPEFVNTNDEGFKSVKYIDLLIAKVSELEARLEKLEGNGCCKCK